MSTTHVVDNESYIRNIYKGGPFQGHAFVCMPRTPGLAEHPDYDFTISDKPVHNWLPWIMENYEKYAEMSAATGDDAVPCAKILTGTHIYAAAFGCEVHRYDDTNPCALPCVANAGDADKTEMPDIWKSPGLVRIFELSDLVRKELGKDAYLAPPDMQSGFDTAALVWDKNDFLCALLDEEDSRAVKRLVDKCARFFQGFLDAYRAEFPNCSPCHCPAIWAPPEMGPWLSNDECGAFSMQVFEEFCLPELVDLSEHFGGIGMHCCADAEHQFESFKKIPNFYGFNRVAARHGYTPILDHFTGAEAPVHQLAWVPEEDIRYLIENAPENTRFIFTLMGAETDDAKAWLARMRELSPRTA